MISENGEVKEPSVRYSPHGGGYVLLWRKALSSAVFQDSELWHIFSWCLLRANWQPKPLLFGNQEVELKRGQFITGRISASQELPINESKIYRLLKKLESLGIITIESNNKFSVVTIVNYDSYQDPSYELEQPLNNHRTTTEQPLNTDKEVKKDKKGKNKTCIPPPVDEVREYFAILGIPDEADAFYDRHESDGWMIGKNKMKDWRAASRTWKRNYEKYGRQNNAANRNGNGQPRRNYAFDASKYPTFTQPPGQDPVRPGDGIPGGSKTGKLLP